MARDQSRGRASAGRGETIASLRTVGSEFPNLTSIFLVKAFSQSAFLPQCYLQKFLVKQPILKAILTSPY